MHWHSNVSNMAFSQKALGPLIAAPQAATAGLSSAPASRESISEDYGSTEIAAKHSRKPKSAIKRALRPAYQAAKCRLHTFYPMDARLEPAVRADRLTKVYKTATAVDGISFTLPYGSI